MFRTRQFVIEDAQAALLALRAYHQSGVDYADALIGFCNRTAGCETTATFDRKAVALDSFLRLE
ncbi:MAG: hypothetical protein ACFCUJ_15310 [Thiotrichales bacterium]